MRVDSFADCLDDLCVRFLLYIPEDEKNSFDRLGFHIEQAYWFYQDMYCPHNPPAVCPHHTLRTFAPIILQHVKGLSGDSAFPALTPGIVDDFFAYKASVPVCGVALVNTRMDKVLLVRGWNKTGKWGFPKGKINKDEKPEQCAARECLEECGYPLEVSALKNGSYTAPHIQLFQGNKPTRIYVVFGIDESFPFCPQTRNEIGAIAWHLLADLPDRKNHPHSRHYFNVMPFVKRLLKIVAAHRKEQSKGVKLPKPGKKEKVSIETLMRKAILGGGKDEAESEGADSEPDAEPVDLQQGDIYIEAEDDDSDAGEDDHSDTEDTAEGNMLDVKIIWKGESTCQESAMLLDIIKHGKLVKRVGREDCLERLKERIPKEGLTEEHLTRLLSLLSGF